MSLSNKGIFRASINLATSNSKRISRFAKANQWFVSLIIVTTLFLLLNHELVEGKVAGIWDAHGQFVQFHTIVADYARQGRFLLWDPLTNGGLPLMGDPQLGAFSPLNILFGLLNNGTYGFILYWLFIWWLGGAGIILLARHLRAPWWGACVVALGFLFCGIYTGNAEHTSWLVGFSFIPWVIWRLDSALCSRRLLPAFQAGALWGLSALAGYPGFTILTGMYAALWAGGRWLSQPDIEEPLGQDEPVVRESAHPTLKLPFVLVALVIILLVGSSVLSPTYFTFLHEGAGNHSRVGALSREVATQSNALHPGALSTFTTNYLSVLQLFNNGTQWSYTDVSMSSIYSGAAIFTLGLLSLLIGRPRRFVWWVFAMAILSLGCALGQALPLRGFLYDWVWPTRFFRFPAIFRGYYLFSISVLAIYSTRALASSISRRDVKVLRLFLFTATGVSLTAITTFLVTRQSLPNLGEGIISFALISWRYPAFGLFQTLSAWIGIFALAFFTWRHLGRRLQWTIPCLFVLFAATDAYMTLKLSDKTMYSADHVALWRALDAEHSTNLDLTHNGLFRELSACYELEHSNANTRCELLTNNQLVHKVPVLRAYATEVNEFHQRTAQDPILYKMAIGTNRIWFAENAVEAEPSDGNFSAFSSYASTSGKIPLLVHSPDQLIHQGSGSQPAIQDRDIATDLTFAPALTATSVTTLKYDPNELIIDTTVPADGWLLVTDRWGRSWQAEVNGNPVAIWGGNFIYRAVQVSKGANRVRFHYSPKGYPELLILSWASLLLVLVITLLKVRSWSSSTVENSVEGTTVTAP